MKYQLSLLLLLISTLLHATDNRGTYKQIRILVPDEATLTRIFESGIDHEGTTGTIGGAMEFVADPYALEQLSKKNILYTVLIDDVEKHYAQQLHKGAFNALGFGYGSMGGYYTYNEVKQQLDTMQLLYPNFITVRESIGTSNEGRALWAVKISDNPNQTETNEPEVLYTALHHAREPEGMMTVLYYMWWLLEHYGTNTTATYLVNQRQLWFIPVVNPDGYVYNQTTNPGGGGFWRKNRRNNGDGTFGVDPNRNYGPEYMWNSSNNGSGTNPADDTYRGTAPFSEPENQSIKKFMEHHTIRTALNYHTFGEYLIYPWGFLTRESADSIVFREFAFDMTAENRYLTGTDLQTVHYGTRGNSDDYMYGDVSKPITYAMTPEVGTSFWPSTSLILPFAKENLNSNINIAYVAGKYPVILDVQVLDQNNNGSLEAGEPFDFSVTVRNKGLEDIFDLTISINSETELHWSSPSKTIEYFPSLITMPVNFSGEVHDSVSAGNEFRIFISIADTSGYALLDTFTLRVEPSTLIFSDDGSNDLQNWNTNNWGMTTTFHSSPSSFADSPFGNYPSMANSILQLATPLDLSNYSRVTLSLWTTWAIQPLFDYGLVEVSTDNETWYSLHSSLSRRSSGRDRQSSGLWGYDGYTPGMEWVRQEFDVTEFIDDSVWIRFRLLSNGTDHRDGWYIDDIEIRGYQSSPVGIQHDEQTLPERFLLKQNYPNPFNPVTHIEMQLAEAGFVKLAVYDMLGREVSVLTKEFRPAGTYIEHFDADKLPSGIYIATMKVTEKDGAERHHQTIKLIVMK
ncbi:MAG: T9SS type A sorting domain-containing protein [Ignavibacteriae bacterium]|nr:T9SS type A sorting domain-containing protein [Ignavibacteriota bacterium]